MRLTGWEPRLATWQNLSNRHCSEAHLVWNLKFVSISHVHRFMPHMPWCIIFNYSSLQSESACEVKGTSQKALCRALGFCLISSCGSLTYWGVSLSNSMCECVIVLPVSLQSSPKNGLQNGYFLGVTEGVPVYTTRGYAQR